MVGSSSIEIDGADDESVVSFAAAGSDDAVNASGDCLRADGSGALLSDGLKAARVFLLADGLGAAVNCINNCVNGLGLKHSGDSLRSDGFGAKNAD